MGPVLVIGCGRCGLALARRLQARGLAVEGINRRAIAAPGIPLLVGDGADAAILARCHAPAQIICTATPGLRGGGDNRLDSVLDACRQRWPQSRLLLTSSSAVYADAGGAAIEEDGPLAQAARPQRLRAIEDAAQRWAWHLVLRVGGLVGPARAAGRQRLESLPPRIAGDPLRPFSYCHDQDLIAVLEALVCDQAAAQGLFNCTAPQRLSFADYYRLIGQSAGLPVASVTGDGSAAPRRWVRARRLWQLLPTLSWHDPLGRSLTLDEPVS